MCKQVNLDALLMLLMNCMNSRTLFVGSLSMDTLNCIQILLQVSFGINANLSIERICLIAILSCSSCHFWGCWGRNWSPTASHHHVFIFISGFVATTILYHCSTSWRCTWLITQFDHIGVQLIGIQQIIPNSSGLFCFCDWQAVYDVMQKTIGILYICAVQLQTSLLAGGALYIYYWVFREICKSHYMHIYACGYAFQYTSPSSLFKCLAFHLKYTTMPVAIAVNMMTDAPRPTASTMMISMSLDACGCTLGKRGVSKQFIHSWGDLDQYSIHFIHFIIS